MRERLIAAFVLVVMFALIVFGFARAYALQGLFEDSEAREVVRVAEVVAGAVDAHVSDGGEVTEAYLQGMLRPQERITYVDADGARVGVTAPDYPDDVGSITDTHPVEGGGSVTVDRSRAGVEDAIADAVLPIVALSLLLMALAGLLGYLAARWLSRPFQELARVANELGRGRFDVKLPTFSIPEAETVGRALATSASQMHQLVVRERDFAANASHQLRTPITALRLELEDLALWRETPPEVAEQLNRGLRELDRLSASVDDLLALARGRQVGGATVVDVSALAEEAVARWEVRAERAGRRVTARPSRPLPVRLAPGPIEQILDVLVGNALTHGSGEIRLEVGELDEAVRVRVGDDGPAPSEDTLSNASEDERQDGRVMGLALAADIAEALGGRLNLERTPTTTFCLTLPKG